MSWTHCPVQWMETIGKDPPPAAAFVLPTVLAELRDQEPRLGRSQMDEAIVAPSRTNIALQKWLDFADIVRDGGLSSSVFSTVQYRLCRRQEG
jgi:hypothetical protein